jgi:GR25 family glycosyltransferase involved in LPS biosynthesis
MTLFLILILIVVVAVVYVIQLLFPPKPAIPCFVISLESHPQNRLSWFRKRYEKSDARGVLPLEVIPAVDGKALGDQSIKSMVSERAWKEIQEAETKGFRTGHYQLTRGAVGCYLSHLEVLQRIATSGGGIVFEDDASIPVDFYRRFRRAFHGLRDKPMDMLLFGCVCRTCEPGSLRKVFRFFQLHGYYVTQKGAQKILQNLSDRPIDQQIDSAMSDLCESGDLQVFCAKPAFVRQGTFRTTIQLSVPKKYKSTIRRPRDP